MTRQIKVGKVKIGRGAPVVIQSMTKTDTRDVSATVKEIKRLEKAGCEVVRLAVKDFEAARAIKNIKKKTSIPLVADIHFDYRLAIECIKNSSDKIRLNPGNIRKKEHIVEIARLAGKKKIPIRVGVNSGSIRLKAQGSGLRAKDFVDAALDYTKILEGVGFYDIIVSLKASDVLTTIEANRLFSKKSKYPVHLGVTAAGPVNAGLVKSSVGIGILLSEGIGDTIRVSLTGDPCEEVTAAKNILQALNLRKFGPEIISCPTCGRCQVDLQSIVKQLEEKMAFSLQPSAFSKKALRIAVMGCEVNGPGEAKEADIGIAFGKNSGMLFKRGKIVRKIKFNQAINIILKEIKTTKS